MKRDLHYSSLPENLLEKLEVGDNAIAATNPAHSTAVLTEWDEFKTLDWNSIHSVFKPAFLFDGRNLLDHAALSDIGFNVYAIGKGDADS